MSTADWGGWGRTSNLPVNSRALCRLSYTPMKLRNLNGVSRLPVSGIPVKCGAALFSSRLRSES